MVQLFAFRRPLVAAALAVCSILSVLFVTPADARPSHRGHHVSGYHTSHHHIGRHRVGRHHARRHHAGRHHVRRGYAKRHTAGRGVRHRYHVAYRGRHIARAHRGAAQFRNSYAAIAPQDGVSTQRAPASSGFASSAVTGVSNVVAEARKFIGGNPTGRSSLWCARFMNMVLQRSGHKTTGSDMARSFASYGRRVSGPQVGAIAVMSRGRGGGHVGVVSGIDGKGNPIVVSGNHSRRVAESVYSRSRIYAYVMPN